MDRRSFLSLSASGLVGLGLAGPSELLNAGEADGISRLAPGKGRRYSVVVIGDTHYDLAPESIYHSLYDEPVEWLNRVQREEFARNGEMWKERCPSLVRRAAGLADASTRFALQLGDLVQGDCGSGEVHRKMLSDAMDTVKAGLGGLPLVTVVGNHDIRGKDAEAVYNEYMPLRMSAELGVPVAKTTFSFTVGDDAWIVVDFNRPDDAEMDRLLARSEGARNTFIVVHGPAFPIDSSAARWFYQGSLKQTEARHHFRREFARRNAIVLCGHSHCTELADWYGDGGRITQMTFNSVWASEPLGTYVIDSEGADNYGSLRGRIRANADGTPLKDESALFDEYRPGLKRYVHSPAAGSYRLDVSPRGITVDFYAGASQARSARFVLR